MILPLTLSRYIGKQFLINTAVIFMALITLIMMIDAVEIIRRGQGKELPSLVILQLVMLKLPHMVQEVMPFTILLGGILSFTKLTRTNELIVARASGISAWQFLAPSLIISILMGAFITTTFNPLSAALLSKFEKIETEHLKGTKSLLTVSSSGLWLREYDKTIEERIIIYALKVSQSDMTLHDFTMFFFDRNNKFIRRVDAKTAQLKQGYWHLKNATFTAPNNPATRKETAAIETSIAIEKLQESFASPETISFWELPDFIKTLEETGFSALKHRIYWHSILISPLLYCAMVFIAAAFSLSPPRQGKTGILMVSGILTGFFIYYVSGLVSALGESGTIPIILAAWAPVAISMIIGLVLMLHLEDG